LVPDPDLPDRYRLAVAADEAGESALVLEDVLRFTAGQGLHHQPPDGRVDDFLDHRRREVGERLRVVDVATLGRLRSLLQPRAVEGLVVQWTAHPALDAR